MLIRKEDTPEEGIGNMYLQNFYSQQQCLSDFALGLDIINMKLGYILEQT